MYKMAVLTKEISERNQALRFQYGENHQDKPEEF
jgi:hypothetical protein